MACILTNDILLENRRQVSSSSAPSTLIYFHSHFHFFSFSDLTGGVAGLNGLVRALILGSQSFITPANANYIPLHSFGDCQIKLCTNSHYGNDNPIQCTQPYLLLTLVSYLCIWFSSPLYLTTGWLDGSLCWTLVFNISFTDFGISNNLHWLVLDLEPLTWG